MAGSNGINASESKRAVPLNTWVLISNFKLAYNMLRRPDGTFDRNLAEFLDRKVPPNATPVNGVLSFDLLIDRATNLLVRIYRPSFAGDDDDADLTAVATVSGASTSVFTDLAGSPSETLFPVIIFFHGGSFAHSSANTAIYDSLCRRFVSLCNAVVISVNYRRSPEHRYPSAYDDGWTALRWATTQPWLRSSSPSSSGGGGGGGDHSDQSEAPKLRVFLAGDSSGGNIVHHVAVRAMDSGVDVAGNILLNPMFGGEARTESEIELDGKFFVTLADRDWYWKAFLPEGADRDHRACNPFGPNGVDLSDRRFTKSLVVVAGLDLVKDYQIKYVEGLRRAGQEVKLVYREKATIGFYLMPNTDHFFEVMEEIKNFVESNC